MVPDVTSLCFVRFRTSTSDTASALFGAYGVHYGAEEEDRNQETDGNRASYQYCKFLESYYFASEEEDAWPESCAAAAQDADTHFSEGLLDFVMARFVGGVGVIRGQVDHIVNREADQHNHGDGLRNTNLPPQ